MTANALQGVVTMWDNGNTIGMLVCMIFYAGTTVLALYLWEKEKAKSRRWKRSYKNIAHLYLSETDKLRDEAERERENRLAAEGESTEWEIHYHELEQKCKAMQEDREVRWGGILSVPAGFPATCRYEIWRQRCHFPSCRSSRTIQD